ncbi:MAG: TIGR04563 family protein [Proteobacteria bacterium]|nr:TIGR04563 family protein [Pseudomonadota bacterium]MBQ4359860.1 TIGR04563 family protein [Pseudomonadota bacterium]
MATKQKLTLYFPPELLEEARTEALRQERTVSWILQKAWEFARNEIHKMPGADDPLPGSIKLDQLRKTAV